MATRSPKVVRKQLQGRWQTSRVKMTNFTCDVGKVHVLSLRFNCVTF